MDIGLADEQATLDLGAALAAVCPARCLIFLSGELGAGKTTLVRGFLRALGHAGTVKSPTYTLVEPYEPGGRQVYHFDLYRVADPDELEFAGGRDYFAGEATCLVEWPERGSGWLPAPDLDITLFHTSDGRRARIQGLGATGAAVIAALRGHLA
ncbi:MAG: tRNA (adenosine(37)-N6)-threonylcarbamoyltransferase complex ATPase subunit type 1 TsaE [Pseudomonadota bacterium]|nr:MAG: tRNA (adenosine(37)-N6)-threonylcarbamoyltransferase complex ATPase subunit type 1 TsaE [Pseudomonadota bacterium]